MTRFGFRWYGPDDSITLSHIRQIPPVSEVVTSLYHIPAGALWPEEELAGLAGQIRAAGLSFTVVEGLPVHGDIKLGLPGRDQYIAQFAENLARLARQGVKTVCYNFMPLFGWIRTDLAYPLPDGSNTLAFSGADMEKIDPTRQELKLPGWNFSTQADRLRELLAQYHDLGRDGMWQNLRYFLQAVVPEADRLGISLAIHPDDPSLPVFGLPRIVSSLEDLLRICSLADTPSNGVTLCSGSLGSNPANDVCTIARTLCAMGRIPFVHARNVALNGDQSFYESGHVTASGRIPMGALLQILYENGFDGVIRPDHGRMVWGEQGRPGYGLYDRAMGVCYLAGLWEATETTLCACRGSGMAIEQKNDQKRG